MKTFLLPKYFQLLICHCNQITRELNPRPEKHKDIRHIRLEQENNGQSVIFCFNNEKISYYDVGSNDLDKNSPRVITSSFSLCPQFSNWQDV